MKTLRLIAFALCIGITGSACTEEKIILNTDGDTRAKTIDSEGPRDDDGC